MAFARDEHAQRTARQSRYRSDEIEQIQAREHRHLFEAQTLCAQTKLAHQESGQQHDGGEMYIGERSIHGSSELTASRVSPAPRLRPGQPMSRRSPFGA